MRGAHDGRTRKPQREIYDEAAKCGITDPTVIEALYDRACQMTTPSYVTTWDVYRSLLQRAARTSKVAPCKRMRTEALYGNPNRWAAPKPGVSPGKRTRTMTLREELAKRERFLKMRELAREYQRKGIPLPNELRFHRYREVMGIVAEIKQRHSDDIEQAFSGHKAMPALEFSVIPELGDPAAAVAGAPIQAKAVEQASDGKCSSGDLESDMQSAEDGQPLPDEVRAKMETLLGADFSAVRIHTGQQARKIGAKAFTRGTDIFFAPGQYQPWTASGQALLAHELTHVKQQAQGRVRITSELAGVAINDDAALEREAEYIGGRAAQESQDSTVNTQDLSDSSIPLICFHGGASQLGSNPVSNSVGIVQRQEQQSESDGNGACESGALAARQYAAALRDLYALGDEFDDSCAEFLNYCIAYENLQYSVANTPDEPRAIMHLPDQVTAVDETGQFVMLPCPEEYFQVDEQLVSQLNEVAQLGLGGDALGALPVGVPGQILLWEDERAVSAPAVSAEFWDLMYEGTPVNLAGIGALSSQGFTNAPWNRLSDSAIHGLFTSGVYQLSTYPISRFQGVSLPTGSRIRFADPRFPIRAQTRVMTIFVPGTRKYYAWDIHSMPVGSNNPPIWHVNQRGMSQGFFGQSNHSPMTPTQIRQGRGLRYLKIGGRVFLVLGMAMDGLSFGTAVNESLEQGTLAPAVAQTVRIVGGWGGAWAGAKLGCPAAAVPAIETGPGAALACIAGGFVGGVAGYFGADWLADLIAED